MRVSETLAVEYQTDTTYKNETLTSFHTQVSVVFSTELTGDARICKLLCDIVSYRVAFSVIVRLKQTDIWNIQFLAFTFKIGQDRFCVKTIVSFKTL